MATQYPVSIDTTVTLPLVYDIISPVMADDHNRLRNAIVSIESELGTNPSSTFGTTKDRLDYLDTLLNTIVAYVMSLSAYQISIADLDGYFAATTVEDALRELYITVDEIPDVTISLIGTAEDGDYSDGLFADFEPTTTTGIAVDRFNEVLKELAPPPAPNLSNISNTTTAGSAGKLSFGPSHAIAGYTNVGNMSVEGSLDVNGVFPSASPFRRGIYSSTYGSKSGNLAASVVAGSGSPYAAYPAMSFGNANQGTLQIWVNGALKHSVNLATFGDGYTLTSGTGFALGAATPIRFPNGIPFTTFRYRTGTWMVSTTHERPGYNFVQVRHVIGATTHTTNYLEWVIDDNTTATSYISEALTSLSMTGSKYLSGVQYHTGGSATYAITVQNLYRNTFSNSASAIYHTNSTNCLPAATYIPDLAGAPYESASLVLSKSTPITASVLHNESITARTAILRTTQSTVVSTGSSQSFLLMNAVTDTATATNEPLAGETYRVPSNRSHTDISGFTLGGAGLWTSSNSLATGPAGYTDGLLVYNGILCYPSNTASTPGITSGDFAIANGPPGNPNYSATSGQRRYLRYFYFSSAVQNFVLNITHSGTNFKNVASGLTPISSDANIELLAPNTTTNGVSAEFKDILISYTSDSAIGCYAATYGSTPYTAWGMTLGTKSTATSGNAIILRITVPPAWTASISNVTITSV